MTLAEGEVVYDIRGDSSNLDGDLNQAEKKTSGFLGKAGGAFKTAGKIAGVAFSAIGSAAVAAGTKAVTGAVDLDQAMNQFAAATGVGEAALEAYEDTLKSIYANNYGESFEDIAGAMASVKQQMGELDQTSLQNITESAYTLKDTFGYEINESVRAASTLMKQFGVTGDEAMNLVATGAQNGLDFSDELIDSINEYSVQFAKVGLNADDMFKIMEKGAETGAWNLDKIGDAIKEMSIRVVDGSDTTIAGFAAIGLNADEMSAKFAKGGDSAKQAFSQTIKALAGMKDPLQQNIAGVNLFGTMWEDLGPEVVTQLANIRDGAYAAGDKLEEMKKVKYDDLGSMLQGLGRSLELLLLPLGEELIPLLTDIIETIMPELEKYLEPIMETLGGVVQQILPLVETLLPPMLEIISMLMPYLTEIIDKVLPVLMEILQTLLPPLMEIVEALLPPLFAVLDAILDPLLELVQVLLPPLELILKAVGAAIKVLTPVIEILASLLQNVLGAAVESIRNGLNTFTSVLQGIIDFIKNVFTGNWEGAWESVKNIFSTIWEGIKNAFKIPINWIIDGINVFIGALNKIKIPDWVPLVGGKGFNIPLIPRLQKGEDFVPEDWFPAYLDYGERVLTREENIRFNQLGGLKGMESMLSASVMGGLSGTGLGGQPIVVQSPVYLDGRLISKNTTGHQFSDVMARRYR